jgi:murein DD-endopeptidase MepM/ murein hydrolase activator NlpD
VLDKLKDHALSLYRSIHPQFDRARAWLDRDHLDVLRHRFAYRLNQRRLLVAVATAMAGLVLGSVTAAAATSGGPSPITDAPIAADEVAMQERQVAAERADRAARGGGGPVPQIQTGHAAAPQESPTPEPEPEPEPEPDWVHPMPGARTTSCFGPRWGTMHAGVDLAAPHGTPIHAVGAGTVTHAGWVFGGYGISVVIDHHDGHYTHYAHASEARVSRGDRVDPGDVIALEGSTGDSTGPHLHFEVHKGSLWNQVEPTQWMNNRGVTIGGC